MILYQFTDENGKEALYLTDIMTLENGDSLKQFTVTETRKEDEEIVKKGVNVIVGIGYNELDFVNLAKNGKLNLNRYNDNTLDVELITID